MGTTPRIFVILDLAFVPIAATALCRACHRDPGQRAAAYDVALDVDESVPLTFIDGNGYADLPCYICGAEYCAEHDENGSCIHSDHTN